MCPDAACPSHPPRQNKPVATPTQGTTGLRDPYILRKQDGTYVVLATDLKGTDWSQQNQYLHVWESADLRSFTNYHRVKMHDMPTHSWAPEAFWDASRNQYGIIYSAVNGGHDVIMVNYTTDFQTVSAPQVFFDPGYSVIDGTMAMNVNGMNYLYFKDSGKQQLVGARSTTLKPGSFQIYNTGVAHGGTEAPILVKSQTSSTWYLWGDTYTPNGVFYAWQTTDLASGTWTPVDQRVYTQPVNSKHATIQPISGAQYDSLVAHYGKPAWNRLKSYNFPARYVRHANSIGRIDQYPFDPFTDSEWKMVPGLADPSADKTAGLADSTWSSFRSYNFPDRYIRHSNYVLRIDPITTATDRSDATFSVGS
ncbi:alpha-L-arabinofuranosidase [Streptomyces montanus]|uniref:Alpha-L-arabinofuranosidase n=1 Tax=Streptomyces montanus TaxID=2580423 RepID=A0A5R9FIN5_9ACTN|nr:AbfB domain-containing protein [Streptomyces montanus]TLS43687.1 alpha-L-arabinofuranosidase [Streptomyces montanus]